MVNLKPQKLYYATTGSELAHLGKTLLLQGWSVDSTRYGVGGVFRGGEYLLITDDFLLLTRFVDSLRKKLAPCQTCVAPELRRSIRYALSKPTLRPVLCGLVILEKNPLLVIFPADQ